MVLLLCLMLMNDPATIVLHTGLYQPLEQRHVAMGQNGHVYFIDVGEKTVVHFDSHGSRLPNVGSSGNGPGQYLIPFDLFVDGNRLFVHDFWLHRVVEFDLDGNFIKNIKQPSTGLRLLKIQNGWLYIKFGVARVKSASRLVITDEDFRNPVVLSEWEKRDSAKPGDYSPSRDICQLVADPDGRYAYFYRPGPFEVFRIDSQSKRMESMINRDLKSLPFDEDWGESVFREFQAQQPERFRPVFPLSFPAIVDLKISPWHTLWVVRGNRPDLQRVMEFNVSGQLLADDIPITYARNILNVSKKSLIIQKTQEDKETFIYIYSDDKISKDKVAKWMEM